MPALLVILFVQDAPEFGYTRPAQEVRLAFPEGGVLRELRVHEGQAVEEGDILARLDTAVLEADAEIAQAQADLADSRLAVLERLAADGRASPDELARARAEASIEHARVRRVEAQIENRTLRSTVRGVVLEIEHEVGESVGAPDYAALTVVRVDELKADLYVPPDVASSLRVEGAVEVIYDGRLRVNATVEFVSPIVEPASGTVRITLALPNAGGSLASGMRVSLAGGEPQ